MKRVTDRNETSVAHARLGPITQRSIARQHERRPGAWIDNRYVVVKTVGWGTTGAVYAAEDVRLQRRVAVKLIHPTVAADPTLSDLFLCEAESMARLRHPNVVEVFDVGRCGSCPYLVMPLLSGLNLSQWARGWRGPPLPADMMVGLVAKVGAGVAAMHEAKLVHGDLKPTNLIVTDDCEVVVADLGLTRPVAADTRFSLPGATPGYLAPELIVHDDVPPEQAFKIDVYALGVIAYWLLTGRTPAGRGTVEEVLRRQIDCEPIPPSELRPEVPVAFDAPIVAALRRDPARRPTVTELCDSLLEARQRAASTSCSAAPLVVVVHPEESELVRLVEVAEARCPYAEVVPMLDPHAALTLMQQRPPELLLTELDLPGLNGLELIASLRGQPSTHAVPVVVVSRAAGAADHDLLRTLGVERVLLGCEDVELLGYAIERALHRPPATGRRIPAVPGRGHRDGGRGGC